MRTYLNTYHVAKSLGVNVQTVRHYIRQGELRAARVGKRYVVTQEDVDDFLESRKKKRSVERIGLTEKGQQMVEKIKGDAERVLAYLDECPGADADEIAEALAMDDPEVSRALRRLEGRSQAYSEAGSEKGERGADSWYPGPPRER